MAGAGGESRDAGPPEGAEVIEMPLIDDMHLHVRQDDRLESVAAQISDVVSRAIIMPNTVPPTTTVDMALAYRDELLSAAGGRLKKMGFEPLMTLYLTDSTSPEEISKGVEAGVLKAVKLYPAGATTNSASGVTDFGKVTPVLARMAELGVPLCVHGEVTDPEVDVFDREERFLATVLPKVLEACPSLKVICEHVTTAAAVEFVTKAPPNVGATITPQHLLYNRNALFVGGIRPHMYCLPVLKSMDNQKVLWEAIRSGNKKFFLGSDSAPHARSKKECPCGCAGIYTCPYVLEYYAQAFDAAGCVKNLPAFATENGADFYGLPRNEDKIVQLWRVDGGHKVADSFEFADEVVVPLMAGEMLDWKARRV